MLITGVSLSQFLHSSDNKCNEKFNSQAHSKTDTEETPVISIGKSQCTALYHSGIENT